MKAQSEPSSIPSPDVNGRLGCLGKVHMKVVHRNQGELVPELQFHGGGKPDHLSSSPSSCYVLTKKISRMPRTALWSR